MDTSATDEQPNGIEDTIDAAGAADQHSDEPTGEASEPIDHERAERLADLKRAAAAGDLEAPSGADEIVDAFGEAVRERDDLFAQLQRSAADMENFRRRARLNEQEAREQATRSIITSILMGLDTFDLALAQDPGQTSAEQILVGVRSIRDEIWRKLSAHGASPIEPNPGDPFEPGRHEAVSQGPIEGLEPGTVGLVLKAGIVLSGKVMRPAQVLVVAEPPAGGPAGDTDAGA